VRYRKAVKEFFDEMFSRLDTMPECDGQTDGIAATISRFA